MDYEISMDAYQIIRRNKIKLHSILRKDINYVNNLLCEVQLITPREKRNLIATTRNRYHNSTRELMKSIMDKGEESCIVFLFIPVSRPVVNVMVQSSGSHERTLTFKGDCESCIQ